MKSQLRLTSLGALAWASIITSAFAADEQPEAVPAPAPEAAGVSDIIVTARLRNETALDAPVVLTAFSGGDLARLGVTNVVDVAKLTPQLVISPATGPYGGNLTLRGVASPTSNPATEPAVTINIDGVPISYGGVVRMATIDVGQVEVLKGPQALFFGKNSSGGIVSIRSAEPTSTFKSQFSVGYEVNAHQWDLDGFVSGPLSDTLTARLAGRFSRQRGYFKNVAPNASNQFRHSAGTDEEGIRLSLNWEPTDQLTVKLRGTYDHVSENGSYSTSQKFACPQGVSVGLGAVPGTDDCDANDTVVFAPFPAAAAAAVTGNPRFDSESNYLRVKQALFVSDISYALSDSLTLSSLTGYYTLRQHVLDSQTSGARFFIGGYYDVAKDTFSQELRLSFSNPDSPFNFMIGGFYQDDKLTDEEQQVINTSALFPLIPKYRFPLSTKSYSAFFQGGWDITKQFSLSAGIRYSEDKKHQGTILVGGVANPKFGVHDRKYTNWSPEVTASFKPNEDVNIFASYKQGYKSGSYNISGIAFSALLANPAVTLIDNSYAPETVKGFEGGVKARLFDRQLRVNLAAYTYLYKDLQLSRLDPVTIALSILNASSARVKGIEGDFAFDPRGVPGLTINGSFGYNLSRYASSFIAPCYVGQTTTGGCNILAPGGTVPSLQQFNGRPLPRAPKFSASLGSTYSVPISDDFKMTLNANAIYTTSSFLSQELSPVGKAPRRVLVDGGIAFGSKSGSYELALIGRNLTNRRFPFSGFQSPTTGGGTGTAVGTLADFEGPISRGREIWLKLTIRPESF